MNWFEYSQILLDKCKDREIPFHIGAELTPLCNFNCNMCYIHLSKEQAARQGKMLSTEQWISIAKEAKKAGTLSMEITGGEAMTRPDFPVLYRAFYDMGYLIVLRTNGYAVNQEIIDLLKNRKPRKIFITLYGASDSTYKKVCGISDGFSVVSRNILALKEAGLTVQLTTTITRENEPDIGDMQKWANENGFYLSLCGMLFTPLNGTGREVEKLKVRLPEEVYELTEEMKSVSREIPNREYYMNPFWMCRAFGAKFTITWDGKMTMCNSNPSVWKDPFRDGLEKAYHDLYSELKTLRRPEKCNTCNYLDLCSVCPSMLYSATGQMDSTTDEMCRMARRKFKNQYLHSDMKSRGEEQIEENVCEEGV